MHRAAFISPDDARWSAFLDTATHDVYHLPEYAVLFAGQAAGRAVAFYAEGREAACLIPFVLRPIDPGDGSVEGLYDLVTPYGFSPPLFTPPDRAAAVSDLLARLRSTARPMGIVSAFFRMHPLLPLPPEQALREHGEVTAHGQTVYLDLRLPAEALWNRVRRGHRRNIRELRRRGYRAVFDDWAAFDAFIDHYHATMDHVGADAFYRFPGAFFYRLREALGARLHLCTVVAPDGTPASGMLFTAHGPFVNGFLGSSSALHRAHAPSKLTYAAVCRWAKTHGYAYFHVGGGVGNRPDALFHFKAGFSPLRRTFYTYRMVFDAEAYRRLVSRREQRLGRRLDDDPFFPRYRAGA